MIAASAPTKLPIEAVLPALRDCLSAQAQAVLVAAPGSGKTTRVPLALLDAPWLGEQRLILLEPRRLAAREAADRMARSLGEPVGATIGYRIRLENQSSATTRILVVTEGIFTRMILDDPMLAGIGGVIFDEVHERSLASDLGMMLALETQAVLRPDLRLIAMSATLDAGRIAQWMGSLQSPARPAPMIASPITPHPIETIYRPRSPDTRMEAHMASEITRALHASEGSILAFLPGQAEIRRVHERLLDAGLPQDTRICPLYGALELAAQRTAIGPAPEGQRKVVLATAIAETSLTIAGISIVVDCGLARAARFDAQTGLSHLETTRAAKSAIDQRRGRAGRLGPGRCYRLWDQGQTLALPDYPLPEIQSADLAGLVLDLAHWSDRAIHDFAFLDAPPSSHVEAAQFQLRAIGALNGANRITDLGRRIQALPLDPRLGAMILQAGAKGAAQLASELALLVQERGLGGVDLDLEIRLDRFRADPSPRARASRQLAQQWARQARAPDKPQASPSFLAKPALSAGECLALAFPDRVARQRKGRPGVYHMANGNEAWLDAGDALARHEWLVIVDLQGAERRARIRSAASLALGAMEALLGDAIIEEVALAFDAPSQTIRARQQRRFLQLTLSDQPCALPQDGSVARFLLQLLADAPMSQWPWSEADLQFLARNRFWMREAKQASSPASDWPDWEEESLKSELDQWLEPFIGEASSLSALADGRLSQALRARLSHGQRQDLDAMLPTHYVAPTQSRIPIDYASEHAPRIEIRLQEMLGLDQHPCVGPNRSPLTIALLSPARRPIQVTRDLPGFWRGSYPALRGEMRGRYPKHDWPEQPQTATPTDRAKPRK